LNNAHVHVVQYVVCADLLIHNINSRIIYDRVEPATDDAQERGGAKRPKERSDGVAGVPQGELVSTIVKSAVF
jgi:hypothetical protein